MLGAAADRRAVPRGSAIAPGYVAACTAASGIAGTRRLRCPHRARHLRRASPTAPDPCAESGSARGARVHRTRLASDPAPTSVDAALGGDARRVHGRGRLRGQARRDARGADRRHARRQGRACSSASASATTLDADALRRAGRRARAARVEGREGRDHAARRRARLDRPRRRRAGVRRGRRARRLPVPRVQVATRSRRSSTQVHGARPRRARRCAAGSTAARASREAVAWARDLVNEPADGEVARRRRREARAARCARNGLKVQGARRRAARARARSAACSVSARARSGRRGS